MIALPSPFKDFFLLHLPSHVTGTVAGHVMAHAVYSLSAYIGYAFCIASRFVCSILKRMRLVMDPNPLATSPYFIGGWGRD